MVAHYIAWTAASSGCEQMFSHLKRSPAELASSKADTDRRLAVVIGAHQDNDEALLIRARELYSTHLSCGRSRSTIRQARVDRGRVGKRRPASKQAWVRQRQAAVGAAARQEAELVTPQRRPRAELPESLAKESAKQDALQKKKKSRSLVGRHFARQGSDCRSSRGSC